MRHALVVALALVLPGCIPSAVREASLAISDDLPACLDQMEPRADPKLSAEDNARQRAKVELLAKLLRENCAKLRRAVE